MMDTSHQICQLTCKSPDDLLRMRLLVDLTGRQAGLGEVDRNRLLASTCELARHLLDDRAPLVLTIRFRPDPAPHLLVLLTGVAEAAPARLAALRQRWPESFTIWSCSGEGGHLHLRCSMDASVAAMTPCEIAKDLDVGDLLEQENRARLDLVAALENTAATVSQRDEELAETNRGVIALYGELEDKSKRLQSLNDELERRITEQSAEALDRQRIETALRVSQRRFKSMADSAPAMLWVTEQNSLCSFLSRGWYDFTGQKQSEGLGTGWTEVIHPDDRIDALRQFNAASRGHQSFTLEFRLRQREGSHAWTMMTGRPRFGTDGTFAGYIGSVIDISERKAAEEALQLVNAQLEERVQQRTRELQHRANQLARMSSELTLVEQRERRRLSQILHDHLQQLLVGAKLGLEVLSRRLQDGDQPAVDSIKNLIGEAIEESRSLTVELSPPILHEAGLDAGLHWLARWMKEKHGLDVEIDTDPRAATDREDVRVLVFQSVRELLFNIVKHAGVNCAWVTMDEYDEDHLRVIVRDEGAGFDPNETVGEGTGVGGGFGLFSIHERLALLGGMMRVTSHVGEGATFELIAPMHAKQTSALAPRDLITAAAAIPPEPEDEEDGGELAESPARPRRKGTIRLLVVDDHEVMRQGLCSLLAEEQDLEVVAEASDGVQAIEEARRSHPDVVLMDFSMPRMDGVEATRRLHEEMPGVRVIGLSMYEESDRSEAMINAGASAYLTKSGKPELLTSTIRQVFLKSTA